MKRLIITLSALFCISLSCLAQSQSMLNTIKSFYTSYYSTVLPQTKRFVFFSHYCTDFDVLSMSQDPGKPENVKVVERTDMKNAYEVNFTQYDVPCRMILICTKEDATWKVDNIIFPEESNKKLFDYDDDFYTCYSLDCYDLSKLLNDFLWSVSIDGQKQVMKFDVTDDGAIDGTAFVQTGSPTHSLRLYKGNIKYDETKGLTMCTMQASVLGISKGNCSIHFAEDQEDLVMESNGRTYIMTLVEPVIR